MLLLVVGLVVIVLVILVVVFLSVRSMRADEGNDRPARSAGRGRAGSGRGDLRGREAGPQPGRSSPAEDEWLADDEAQFAGPEPDQERAPLPRPRGPQHDEDPGRGPGPQKRGDARRRQRQEAASRAARRRPGQVRCGLAGRRLGRGLRRAVLGGAFRRQAARHHRAVRSGCRRRRAGGRGHLGRGRGPGPGPVTPGTGPHHGRHGRLHRPVQPPSRVSAAGPPAFRARPAATPEPFGFADPGAIAGSSASPEPWSDPMGAGSGGHRSEHRHGRLAGRGQ